MTRTPEQHSTLLSRPAVRERRHLAEALRTETVGGMMLLGAAVVALLWANFPIGDSYSAIRDFHFGVPALGLDLSVGHWASDGLLTVFFFVAGIELKRELVVGELRRPAAAALPVVAALCGMLVPAGVYLAVNLPTGGDTSGWAVPMATDIAFALGVLAVISTHLPSALRAFLLTLAVADDLGAIIVIAIFFTSSLNLPALFGALAGLLLFLLLHRKGVRGWYIYVPLALVIWALMFNSGIHATIAGVAMGMLLRVTPRPAGDGQPAEDTAPAEHVEHLVRPLSAGLAVPLFALFAAGVQVSGGALGEAARQPEAIGVVLGLSLGKLLGVFGGTYLAARFTRAQLNPDLRWSDLAGVSMLAGIGFTVSLLITELGFTDESTMEHVKAAVLVGSLLSALVAVVLLRRRDRVYRQMWEEETQDKDQDGLADLDARELAEEKGRQYDDLLGQFRAHARPEDGPAGDSRGDTGGTDGTGSTDVTAGRATAGDQAPDGDHQSTPGDDQATSGDRPGGKD